MNANRLAGASNEMMASLQTADGGSGAAQRRVALCLSAEYQRRRADLRECRCRRLDRLRRRRQGRFLSGPEIRCCAPAPFPSVQVLSSATPANVVSVPFRRFRLQQRQRAAEWRRRCVHPDPSPARERAPRDHRRRQPHLDRVSANAGRRPTTRLTNHEHQYEQSLFPPRSWPTGFVALA